MFLSIDFEKSKRYRIMFYQVGGFGKFDYYAITITNFLPVGMLLGLSIRYPNPFAIGLAVYFLMGLINSRKLWVVNGLDLDTNFKLAYDVLNRDLDSKQIATTADKNFIGRFSQRKWFNVSHFGTDIWRRQIVVIFDNERILVNSALLINRTPSAHGLVSQIYLVWFLITLKLEIRKKRKI